MIITTAIPTSALSGNIQKGGYHKKHAEKVALRDSAWLQAVAKMHAEGWQTAQRARLHIHIYYKDKRRRDTLNTINGLKSSIDGCVKAGILVDDDWQHMEIGAPKVSIDRENPRCELKFESLI